MKYFVYELVDPRNGLIFYIGKGCGNRPAQHVREAMAGKNTAKCRAIREILADGQEVAVVISKRFRNEAAAYAYEKKQILLHGLDNLTNMQPGGPMSWVTKKNPDAEMVGIIAMFARKTNGLKDGVYRWWFCQAWHELPKTLIASLKARLCKIVDTNGFNWTAKELAKHNVTLLPSTVEELRALQP